MSKSTKYEIVTTQIVTRHYVIETKDDDAQSITDLTRELSEHRHTNMIYSKESSEQLTAMIPIARFDDELLSGHELARASWESEEEWEARQRYGS